MCITGWPSRRATTTIFLSLSNAQNYSLTLSLRGALLITSRKIALNHFTKTLGRKNVREYFEHADSLTALKSSKLSAQLLLPRIYVPFAALGMVNSHAWCSNDHAHYTHVARASFLIYGTVLGCQDDNRMRKFLIKIINSIVTYDGDKIKEFTFLKVKNV